MMLDVVVSKFIGVLIFFPDRKCHRQTREILDPAGVPTLQSNRKREKEIERMQEKNLNDVYYEKRSSLGSWLLDGKSGKWSSLESGRGK